MEESDHAQHVSALSSSSSHPVSIDDPSSSSIPTSQVENDSHNSGQPQQNQEEQLQQQQQQQRQSPGVSHLVNVLISNVATSDVRDDVWSCLIVLVTFWFFASMTLIMGVFGSVNLQLGPNCSRLIQTNPLFVQSVKAKLIDDSQPGPMLYGFYKSPPLDVEITWTETHNALVPIDLYKEWVYFLNKGSKVDVFYSVKSPSSLPLSLVIAQGRESLVEWIDDPSYPNTTLSWNIIYGSGKIQQEISKSSNYYIAVGNLNSDEVEVELKFMVKAFIHNTTQAYYRCSLGNHLCSFKLFLFGASAAVLTSSPPNEGASDDGWHVKMSYGPRWIIYFLGSGMMTVLMLLAFRFCNMFQTSGGAGDQAGEMRSEQAPLLSDKDDDMSSWGSSYDSISHDEEDLDEWLAVNSLEGKTLAEGENSRRLCVICFDASRECFFLPCGHCAACFSCGTRIVEEAGNCPICHRTTKKVRKIFTV